MLLQDCPRSLLRRRQLVPLVHQPQQAEVGQDRSRPTFAHIAAFFACFTTGRWEITASNGALYWPALLKGVGARTSPRLAWPAIVSGKAVAWWAGL